MKQRSNDELSAIISNQLTIASDYAGATVQAIRGKSWDYFLNRPRGDEITGRSQVQDTTIRDTYHAIMSTLMPSYATDHIVAFEPEGEGDEEQAESESRALNNIFTEDNSGYLELQAAVSDCLLFRNGVVKVWLEDQTEIVTQSFQDKPGVVYAYLKAQGVEVTDVTEADGVTTATISQTRQKLRFKAIEQSYILVDPNHDSADLSDCAFIAERTIMTRQELKDMGVSKAKIDQLPQIADESTSTAAGTTNVDVSAKFVEEQPSYQYTSVWSEQRVECYWVSMKLDGEKWRFLYSHNTVLLKDSVAFFNYAGGAAYPVPHRWSGLCLYDLLQQTQDSKTSIIRQYLDNLRHANNQRNAYNPQETKPEDMNSGKPGHNIRSTNPANIVPIPVMDITSNSLAGLDHFSGVATRQAGAALDMATAEAQTMKDVSGLSVEMQQGPAEQLTSQVGRSIAESLVRQMFLIAHRLLREEYTGTITYRHTDEWVTVNPSEWQPSTRMNICVGLSPGERRRHRAALQEVIGMQMQFIQGGAANISTDWAGVHAAITDWMKAAELDSAEGYFINPDSRQAQEAQQAAAEEQAQGEDMQAQLAQMQMQMEQQKVQMEQQKLELDKYKHDSEMKWKYYDTDLDAGIEEAKIVESGIQSRINARGSEGTGADTGAGQSG